MNEDIDYAVRCLYSFASTLSPSKRREQVTKHGGFESIYLTTNEARNQAKSTLNTIEETCVHSGIEGGAGYLYGNQNKRCRRNHVHSRGCSKTKELDLAEVQTKAFKFMVL